MGYEEGTRTLNRVTRHNFETVPALCSATMLLASNLRIITRLYENRFYKKKKKIEVKSLSLGTFRIGKMLRTRGTVTLKYLHMHVSTDVFVYISV